MQEMSFTQETLDYFQMNNLSIEYHEGTQFSTNCFLVHPNGLADPVYADWVSIQNDFNSGALSAGSGNWTQDGTQFNINMANMPDFPPQASVFLKGEQTGTADLFILVGWALALVIIAVAFAVCVISWGILHDHACGWSVNVTQLNDCQKLVTKPDCSHNTFDMCANSGEGAWTGNWSGGGFDWMTLVWVGAALVGVYILITTLPGLLRGSSGNGGGQLSRNVRYFEPTYSTF